MDFFFQRHFSRRQKRKKYPAVSAVQTSKARRRSSAGLPSVTLAQSRRSSIGFPPDNTDQRRRPSIGLLVASGQKRQSIIELGITNTSEGASTSGKVIPANKRGRRAFQYNAAHIAHTRRGLAVRYRRRSSEVKSIEPHLLGSSMLLASLVQMGKGAKEVEEEEEEEEVDVSLCSSSESDIEDVSYEEVEKITRGIKELHFQPATQMHLTEAVIMKNIKTHPFARAPRCLRRNSSHLLPADSVFNSSDLSCGVYGQYNPRRSSQVDSAANKVMHTSMTTPSLGHLASSSQCSDLDLDSSGSTLPKSCSSPLDGPGGTIYYDPYLETWENFLSYVTHTNTCTHTVCIRDCYK